MEAPASTRHCYSGPKKTDYDRSGAIFGENKKNYNHAWRGD